MSQMGQKLRFESRPVTSGLPPTPDISLHSLTDAMCQYWSSRLESIGRQGLFDRGRRQESDKLLGGVNLLAVRDDPPHTTNSSELRPAARRTRYRPQGSNRLPRRCQVRSRLSPPPLQSRCRKAPAGFSPSLPPKCPSVSASRSCRGWRRRRGRDRQQRSTL